MKKHLLSIFNQHYEGTPLVVRSPGRINIIGEHIDYNGGLVLPSAINKYIYVAISKREDTRIVIYSVNFDQIVEADLNELSPTADFSTYVFGVVNQINQRGYSISGFNLVIDGDIPVGAGLSSSAALESAVAFAINQLFQLGISKLDIVSIAQTAERTFAGVNCGVMDMFASVFGQENSALKLDCDTLEFEYIPLILDGYSLVLLNSNVKHSLASSEYNVRRNQCEIGLKLIKEKCPEVSSFKDVSLRHLVDCVQPFDDIIFNRCSYVVNEMRRVNEACEYLKEGNLKALGQLLYATHDGLSHDYEVSCFELDFLVESIKENEHVLGARMMGGGFGGCTLNIIKNEAIDLITEQLKKTYAEATGLELEVVTINAVSGSEIVN
jgi:galactokinase